MRGELSDGRQGVFLATPVEAVPAVAPVGLLGLFAGLLVTAAVRAGSQNNR